MCPLWSDCWENCGALGSDGRGAPATQVYWTGNCESICHKTQVVRSLSQPPTRKRRGPVLEQLEEDDPRYTVASQQLREGTKFQ